VVNLIPAARPLIARFQTRLSDSADVASTALTRLNPLRLAGCGLEVLHLGTKWVRYGIHIQAGVHGLRGEPVRQPCQPAAQEAVNVLWSKLLTNGLQPGGILTCDESVLPCFEADPLRAKLAFGIFVPVQTEFGVAGEVGGEFQEELTEVTIQTIQ
jgi:hypothetical protein